MLPYTATDLTNTMRASLAPNDDPSRRNSRPDEDHTMTRPPDTDTSRQFSAARVRRRLAALVPFGLAAMLLVAAPAGAQQQDAEPAAPSQGSPSTPTPTG